MVGTNYKELGKTFYVHFPPFSAHKTREKVNIYIYIYIFLIYILHKV